MRNLFVFLFVLGLAVLPQIAQAECVGDAVVDGVVNVQDLVEVITQWGPCAGCGGDVVVDGVVNVQDLVAVITAWGPCPMVPTCDDLAEVDFMAFGGPPMPLGAAVANGICSMIFGNGIPEGIALWANVEECQANCNPCYTNDDCAVGEYCNLSADDDVCAAAGQCELRAEVCITIYDPICSCNNTIVSNACVATNQGASVQYAGECPQEDVCNFNGGTWNPDTEECDCPEGDEYNYQRGCQSL